MGGQTLPSAQAADLLGVYRDALNYDAQYAAAKAQRDAGLERQPQGLAGLLPNVGLTANTTWNRQDATFTGPTTFTSGQRQFNSNAYTLTLTQPLFRWQNWIQYDQSKLQVAQAETQFLNARQDLILRVAQAYFDVLLAQDALAFAQTQKTAIGEQLEQAKRNFEVGTSTIVDTHEAQARFDLATSQEIAAQNDLEVKRYALGQIIGKQPEQLSSLRQTISIEPPQPPDMQRWVETAETSNYNVQVQQAALEIATQEVDRNRAGHYPTLDAVATYGTTKSASSAQGFGSDITASTIGLQFALPIYQGGIVLSRTREAVALREKALQDLENTRRTSALNARQAYLGVTSGMAQVRALEAGLVSSRSALDSNKLGYEVGVRINIDVLNAQQQVSQTQRDLAQARYNTLISQLKLKAAAGTLGQDDVQQLNALLER
jgi:outer membrane protein